MQSNRIMRFNLEVPTAVLITAQYYADLVQAKDVTIAGGFLRGLALQQIYGLDPKMSDLDVFADSPALVSDEAKAMFASKFGDLVRDSAGYFKGEKEMRSILQYRIPEAWQPAFAGTQEIQFNFGENHVWRTPDQYLSDCNMGINQIVSDLAGNVWVTNQFLTDLMHKQMTMNANRTWNTHDWERTVEKAEKMIAERSEFADWELVQCPAPEVNEGGEFWDKLPALIEAYNLDMLDR